MLADSAADGTRESNPLAGLQGEQGWETRPERIAALHAVFDLMPKALAVVNREGKVIFANPVAKALLGGHEHEPPEAGSSASLLARILRGEVVDGQEVFVASTQTHDRRWLRVRIWPLLENAAVSGSVILIRETTAIKRAAEIVERDRADGANRTKSEFLRRTSQELRTHLNSILGFAQMLTVDHLNPEQHNNVQRILTGGYHVLELISQLADLAHLETGSFHISLEPVRIKEALKKVLQMCQTLAADQQVTLRFDIGTCRDSHLRADRRRLNQVLLNLLSHVIRSSQSGGVVSLTCEETPGNRLRIEICGDGVDAEDYSMAPSALLPMDLASLDDSESGLAPTLRLVRAMGGNLGLQDAKRLFVEFPLLEDPLERLTGDAAAMHTLARSVPQQGLVLYFEDDPTNLMLIERIFAYRPGIKLLKAMDAKSGLDIAETHRPDWILLDLNLPDMPGEEVLRRLRESSRTCHIPVTIVSGDGAPETIRQLVAAGARDYLTKPLDIRKLLALLDQTLRIQT